MSTSSAFRACMPFTPRNLALVHEAYPKSKTATEPDSNGLGKLTFYTRARPIKLAKVGRELLRRCERTSEPLNSLSVSMTILKQLLQECRADVNVFCDDAMACISAALKKAKASNSTTDAHSVMVLYEKTAGAFFALVTFAQQFALNEALYMDILTSFCHLATDDSNMAYRLIGLHALEGVVEAEYFQNTRFQEQNALVMNTLLKDLAEARISNGDIDFKAISQQSGNEKESPFLGHPSLRDRRARSIRIAKGMEKTEKPLTSTDAAQAAVKALFALLRVSRPKQITAVLEETSAFLDREEGGKYWSKATWCAWLAGQIFEACPAQHRYLVEQHFMRDLQANSDVPSKQTSLIQILIALYSAPRDLLLNFSIGDQLRNVTNLLMRHPNEQGYVKAILVLESQQFMPEQLSYAIASLLDAAVNAQSSSTADPQAVPALLSVTRQLVDIALKADGRTERETKQELSTERLSKSLHLLENKEPEVRIAYLEILEPVLRKVLSQIDRNEAESTSPEVPSITLSSSVRREMPLETRRTVSFFKALQVRLGMALEKRSIAPKESAAIERILETIYASKEGQVVVDGVPILMAWKTAAGESAEKQACVARLLSAASRTMAETWKAELVPDAGAFMQSLAASTELQKATSLSEADLATRLSQPYTASVVSPTSGSGSLLETLASPSRSVRTSRYAGTTRTGGAASLNMSLKTARMSEASITVADLKAALMGGSSPARSGKTSPTRSYGSAGSELSRRGHPPNAPRISPPTSVRSSGRGTPQKPKLERIPGSMDESRSSATADVFTTPKAGPSATAATSETEYKFPNPPYKLF